MYRSLISIIALTVDHLFGDPPNRFHPVAWMGSFIADLQKNAPQKDTWAQFRYGWYIIAAGVSMAVGIGWLMERIIVRLPAPQKWLAGGIILKLMLALRGLCDASKSIQSSLMSGDITEARRLVGWHLVSRDTSQLSETQVAGATIESVAENTADGVIAPLFYYAIWGLPGAIVYRFVNTADTMLGYRDTQREWLGKIPARLDDLLNVVPARVTALLLLAAGRITGRDTERAIAVWRRDQHQTDSPNAGHPMSMAAGLLDVELEKTGQYSLGSGNRPPEPNDIDDMVHLSRLATLLAVLLLALISLTRHKPGK